MTDPIVRATQQTQFDPYQFYRAPLFRTMAGYKFLSGTFLLCGTLAVPALLYTGSQEGVTGAIAVGAASLLPLSLQTIMLPRYVARMRLEPAGVESDAKGTHPARASDTRGKRSASTAPMDLLDGLLPQSEIRIEYFTLFGPLKSRVEKIGDLTPHTGYRWANWKNRRGMSFYVERSGAGPILKKVFKMIEHPDRPETWRTY